MRTIQVRGKTGADGVLHLSIPLGMPHGEFEVVVVVEPQPVAVHPDWPPGFFEQTGGRLARRTGTRPAGRIREARGILTTYLLDTNTCVHYLRKRNPHVVRRIQARPPQEIRLCSVVQMELYYGAYKSPPAYRPANLALLAHFFSQFTGLAFEQPAAERRGRIRAHLESLGTPIGPYDLQIASIALVHQLTVVTHNVAEFSRVPGLTVEDWEVP